MDISELSTHKILNIMKEVDRYVNKDVSYIDALIEYASKHNIEIELLGEIVKRSAVLKAKVRDDAETLNLIEKSSKLPI